ncbi:MAG: ribbon-helix-helix domain-containing protein [Cellulomonadaceae bacterium]|nr:ribbon-helix-helix domain-containing protein [Cellulomonadaceae bacterium]
MKTTISLPDDLAEKFDKVAAANGMNRSEFYQKAGANFAEALDEDNQVAAINEAIAAVGQPEATWVGASMRHLIETGNWEW